MPHNVQSPNSATTDAPLQALNRTPPFKSQTGNRAHPSQPMRPRRAWTSGPRIRLRAALMHPKAVVRWKPAPGRICPFLRLPCGSHGTGNPMRGAGHPRQLFIPRARSQVGERLTPLTVAISRSAGARSTSGVSLSVDCVPVPATRAAVTITGNLKRLHQACRPPRRPAGKLSPQLRASASCGKPVAPAQSRLTGIRTIPTSTPGRSHIYADPIYIMTAASSDDHSASLSPEAAFAISLSVKSAPTIAGERPEISDGERTSSICSCQRAPQSGS